VKIALDVRMKHAALWEAVAKCGNQSALARRLGVSASELGDWVNLRRCPSLHKRPELMAQVEKELFALTGKTFDELFPAELRQAKDFLGTAKRLTLVREVSIKRLTTKALLALPAPDGDVSRPAELSELRKSVAKVLKTLTYREREIIKLRYGLGNDGMTYTPEEVGHIFKVTRERIRQIEAKALRKMQIGPRAESLVGFTD